MVAQTHLNVTFKRTLHVVVHFYVRFSSAALTEELLHLEYGTPHVWLIVTICSGDMLPCRMFHKNVSNNLPEYTMS